MCSFISRLCNPSSCFYAVIAWIIWGQLLDIDDGASRVISTSPPETACPVQHLILDSNEVLGSIEGSKWSFHI